MPHITLPTLVIWGKYDQYLDVALAERFKNTMPDVEVVVIDKCGHSAHEECPDKVNQLILDFLQPGS